MGWFMMHIYFPKCIKCVLLYHTYSMSNYAYLDLVLVKIGPIRIVTRISYVLLYNT